MPTDKRDADSFGTLGFAFGVVSAGTKTFGFHLIHHGLGPLIAFGLALRQQTKMRNFGSREQHRGTVGTGRHAGTTANAGRGIKRLLGNFRLDRNRVGFRFGPRMVADVTARLDDPVKCAAVDDQIVDHRKCPGPPWLDVDFGSVLEVTHVQLAGRRFMFWPWAWPLMTIEHMPQTPSRQS